MGGQPTFGLKGGLLLLERGRENLLKRQENIGFIGEEQSNQKKIYLSSNKERRRMLIEFEWARLV